MFSRQKWKKSVYLSFQCYFPCSDGNHWPLPAVKVNLNQFISQRGNQMGNKLLCLRCNVRSQWQYPNNVWSFDNCIHQDTVHIYS